MVASIFAAAQFFGIGGLIPSNARRLEDNIVRILEDGTIRILET